MTIKELKKYIDENYKDGDVVCCNIIGAVDVLKEAEPFELETMEQMENFPDMIKAAQAALYDYAVPFRVHGLKDDSGLRHAIVCEYNHLMSVKRLKSRNFKI